MASFKANVFTVGTTRVSGSQIGFSPQNGVNVLADPANTSPIMIGEADVTAVGNGFPLVAGASIFIPARSLNELFFIAGSTGNKLWYFAT